MAIPIEVVISITDRHSSFKVNAIALVLRFRSSHHIAASPFANFGIKGALANL